MDYTNDKINEFITQLEKDNGINTKKIKSFRNLLNNFISSEKEKQIEKQKKEEQDQAKKKSFIETKKFLLNDIKIVTMKSEKYGMEDVLNNPSLNIGKTQDPEKIIVIMGLGYDNIYQYDIMRYNYDSTYKFKYKLFGLTNFDCNSGDFRISKSTIEKAISEIDNAQLNDYPFNNEKKEISNKKKQNNKFMKSLSQDLYYRSEYSKKIVKGYMEQIEKYILLETKYEQEENKLEEKFSELVDNKKAKTSAWLKTLGLNNSPITFFKYLPAVKCLFTSEINEEEDRPSHIKGLIKYLNDWENSEKLIKTTTIIEFEDHRAIFYDAVGKQTDVSYFTEFWNIEKYIKTILDNSDDDDNEKFVACFTDNWLDDDNIETTKEMITEFEEHGIASIMINDDKKKQFYYKSVFDILSEFYSQKKFPEHYLAVYPITQKNKFMIVDYDKNSHTVVNHM